MSTAEKRRLTPQEYLEIDEASEIRHEFLDGEIFAMSGATFWHTLIKDNLSRTLGNKLAAKDANDCYVLTSDQRVKVSATGLYTYPDILICCGEPVFDEEIRNTLVNPRVLIEVLSESTERYDRGAKFGHYRQLASVQEYLLIAQDRPCVERYVREPVAGDFPPAADRWVLTAVTDAAGSLLLESVGVEVTLADIYDRVVFPPVH
jgi:Uma2 family endonuclease